jgi:hypothetical protein
MSQRQVDKKWNQLCKIVEKRDSSCRLLRCLTPGETKIIGLKCQCRLDKCHVLARSISPENIYNPKNVYRINSFSHHNLDKCQSPLTGDPIKREERDWWWWRIINKSTERYNPEIDYEFLVKQMVEN